jgi:hypothetical protein
MLTVMEARQNEAMIMARQRRIPEVEPTAEHLKPFPRMVSNLVF